MINPRTSYNDSYKKYIAKTFENHRGLSRKRGFFALTWNFNKEDKNIYNAFHSFFEFSKSVLWNIKSVA